MFGDFHATTLLKREDSKGGGGTTEGTTNIPPGQTKAGDKRGKKEAEAPRLWAVFGGIPPERRGGRAPKNPFHRVGGGKEKSGAICTVSSFLEGGGGLGVTKRGWNEREGGEEAAVSPLAKGGRGGARKSFCYGGRGRELFAEAQSTSKRMERERGKRRRLRRRSPLHRRSLFAPLPFFRFIVFSLTTQAEGRPDGKERKRRRKFLFFRFLQGGGRKRLRGRERRKTRSGGWRGYKIFAVRKLRGWSKTSP